MTAVSFALLAVGVTNISTPYSDEHYYLAAARAFMAGTPSTNPQHPPFAKYLIAASMWVLGDNPLGWRTPSLLAGTLLALGLFGMTYQLTRDIRTSYIAWLLTIFGGFWYGMSRVAMISVIELAFEVSAIWLALIAMERGKSAWYVAAGLLFGLSVASRWFGAMGLLVCLVVSACRDRWAKPVVMWVAAVLTYFVTWIPLLVREHRSLSYLVPANLYILNFHRTIAIDPNNDPVWTWFAPTELRRGMWFIANPVIGLLGLVALAVILRNHRKWDTLPVLLYCAHMLPWALGVKHVVYYYYYFEAYTFLAVALAIVVSRVKVASLRLDFAVSASAMGYFAYWFPAWGHFPFGGLLY